ncbi:MAG: DUF1543 domain-containing protein [Bdellovibrionaceae bacterium]|nr:DUF1543 domain-containing protein [Pseudobdellovibrionaceae bacterium]
MNLYSIHCGFYDEEISEGIYEFHVNIPIAAKDLEEAKSKVRTNLIFQKKKMHIDGIQEIKIVDGLKVELKVIESASNETVIDNHLHRDL